MKILGVETATEACSVALWIDGEIISRHVIAPREHARLVLPFVEQVMGDAGISRSGVDAVAFGRGPGAFTGVRVAVSMAQGLAYGLDRPAVPISTLAALAKADFDVNGHPRLIAAMDARMGEVYVCAYDCSAMREVIPEQVAAPERVNLPEGAGWHGVGSGFRQYPAQLDQRFVGRMVTTRAQALPDACAVVRLAAEALEGGAGIEAQQARPVYLRDRVAEPKPKPLSQQQRAKPQE